MSEDLVKYEDKEDKELGELLEDCKQYKLTQKEELFVSEYIKDGNGSRAVMLAYDVKNANTASSMAYLILKREHIKQAVKMRKHDIWEHFKLEAENMFNLLCEMANNPNTPPRVKIDAIRDVLDRAGYKPIDKQEITGNMTLDTPATREMLARARNIKNITKESKQSE